MDSVLCPVDGAVVLRPRCGGQQSSSQWFIPGFHNKNVLSYLAWAEQDGSSSQGTRENTRPLSGKV